MSSRYTKFLKDLKIIQSFDLNNIKKRWKNILIYYIGYVTIKDLKSAEISSVNPLYLILSKVNRYFEQIK